MNMTQKSNRPAKAIGKKNTARPPAAERPMPLRLARAVARGALLSCAITLALSLIGAAIAGANADPDRLLLPLSIGITALAATAGGLFTRRAARLSPLVCGLLHGACLLLLSLALACLADGGSNAMSATVRWGLRGGMLVFSILGALMGANLPKAKKKKRRM